MTKKTLKQIKMHRFKVFTYKSQEFAQSQENLARSHNRETVKFRKSARL